MNGRWFFGMRGWRRTLAHQLKNIELQLDVMTRPAVLFKCHRCEVANGGLQIRGVAIAALHRQLLPTNPLRLRRHMDRVIEPQRTIVTPVGRRELRVPARTETSHRNGLDAEVTTVRSQV